MTSKGMPVLPGGGSLCGKTPANIQKGLVAICVAFHGGKPMADRDRAVWMRIAASLLAGFEIELVEAVLGDMLIHNPRNPFPPTPQDLYEACDRIANPRRGADGLPPVAAGGEPDQWRYAGDDKLVPGGPSMPDWVRLQLENEMREERGEPLLRIVGE